MRSWLNFTVAWLTAVGLVGAGASYFFEISFWTAVIIAGLALVANGLLAEWEDHQPGGFYNPRDEDLR